MILTILDLNSLFKLLLVDWGDLLKQLSLVCLWITIELFFKFLLFLKGAFPISDKVFICLIFCPIILLLHKQFLEEEELMILLFKENFLFLVKFSFGVVIIELSLLCIFFTLFGLSLNLL